MHVGLILKISKFCNLRCTYCCEMDHLGDQRRMSLDQIETILCSVRTFLEAYGSGDDGVSLYWHGGEPLVQPVCYWTAIREAQERCFGEDLCRRTSNALQSNLTLAKPAHLPLLSWMRIGFSYDVVNDLRVDIKGRPSADQVVRNVDWLTSVGVPLAGIVVVSKANATRHEEVADFYLSRRLSFRFILLDEALEHRAEVRALRVGLLEYVHFAEAMWRLPRVRQAIAGGLRIDPLSEVLSLLRDDDYGSGPPDTAALAGREHLLEVDTDGSVYSTADYPYRRSYGSIFEQPLEQLLLSDGRGKRVARSRDRLDRVCSSCRFLGRGCSGARVSHATEPVYVEYVAAGGCELSLIANVITPPTASRAA